ncbi:mucin-5AC-like isoform X2 [Homarus americanus]|uniref:mucin-5AC-like isoform X2 n=1 Tax=Homarus americanus TaxID=6706 RepID=UPI001C4894F2|nr:mucin-5AC-like isoform X2 [Homarus americanus]
MIDVVSSEFAIENYAQVAGAGGSWMEWENRRRRDAEESAWPPPRPPDFPSFPEGPWSDSHTWEDDPEATPLDDNPWEDFALEDNHWEDTGATDDDGLHTCDCGGPPPPMFNLPPPPPIPKFPEEEEEGSGCDAPPPSEVCPALLVAGGAHTHQRLHPPLAALVVAAATLTLVFIIAALVCWRRQRGRRGPSKSTSDLTNGVIYEDLPSGPTPRVVPASHGHAHTRDTHTLAPMELLDMKLTSHVHNTSYGGAETTTPTLLQQYQTPQQLSPTFTHGHTSPPYSPKQTYDAHRSSRSSQEIYNPTYEEISTAAVDGLSVSPSGSDTTSVSSASVSSEGTGAPQPRERIGEGPGPPGIWSEPGSCTCSGRRAPQGRRGVRGGRTRKPRATSSATSTGTTEGSEYHEALLPQLVPALAMKGTTRHPALPYTIQGTSDGRTSTSSSSDLPVDRCLAPREPRYYVGVPPPITRSPSTPDGPGRGPPGLQFGGDSIEGSSGTSTCGGERPSPTERGLPPLPSRSDRYRIYFTTERRRGAEVAPHPATTRTLDPAARKRQRRYDTTNTRENEPLYHEL